MFGNTRAEETKGEAFLLRVVIQLTTQPGMTYDELNLVFVASATYLTWNAVTMQ